LFQKPKQASVEQTLGGHMQTWKKFMIGGIGGAIPLILNLMVIDYQAIFLNFTLLVGLGYFLRFFVYFGIGGFWASLHNENNKKKLFELGILAPALITAMINAGNVKDSISPLPLPEPPSASFSIISPAYADPVDTQIPKQFAEQKETATQQIWRGLIGSFPQNTWFIITGQSTNLNQATLKANQINKTYPNISANVYQSFEDSSLYMVVIGEHLTYDQAAALKDKAIADGISKDTYLWQLPVK